MSEIVGYTLNASNYCPCCVLDMFAEHAEDQQTGDTEIVLDRVAPAYDVDRSGDVDSNIFPVPFFEAHGECEDYQPCTNRCGACGEEFDDGCGALPVPTEGAFTELYRDMLDEVYPAVEIAGITFDVSRVLEECDPIAFRIGMLEYADSMGIHEFAD